MTQSNNKLSKIVIILELIGFGILIIFLWLDEIIDLPHILFKTEATPINYNESIIESVVVLLLCILIVFITQRYIKKIDKLMLKLKEQNKNLKEVNSTKNKMFSVISHDLRSPFASLFSLTSLLSEDLDILSEDEIRRYSKQVQGKVKNVQNMLENLLQWARFETGKLTFKPEKINLYKLATEVIRLLNKNIKDKNNKIVNNLAKDIFVFADKNMINSVFLNLITNANKFTKSGIIELSAEKNQSGVQITVLDNGIGIDQENLKKIFKKDLSFSNRGTEGEKGSGLGLMLCKEFIEKQGGKIWVKSELKKGSTFYFTLPIYK